MKKKYILNGKIYDEETLSSYADKSGLHFDDYIKEAGAKEHVDNNTYILNGKEYDGNTMAGFAQKSDMGYEDYLKEAGVKKKEISPNGSKNAGVSASQISPNPKEVNKAQETYSPTDFLLNDIKESGKTIDPNIDTGLALMDHRKNRDKELTTQQNILQQDLLNYHQDKSVQQGDMPRPQLAIPQKFQKELHNDQHVQDLTQKIQDVKIYKQKLNASIGHEAAKYAAKKTNNAVQAGQLVRTIIGDPTISKEMAYEEKGLPISQAQQFYNEKTGLDALETGLDADHEDKTSPDYLTKKADIDKQRNGLLNKYPEFKSQQLSNAVAQQIVKDNPNANRSDLWLTVPKAAKELGLSDEDIKAIHYDDIPIQGALGKTFGGAYNALLGIGAGIERIGGTLLGIDKDKLTSSIESGTQPAERRYEDIRGTQGAPSIVDANKNSPTFLQNIPNPDKGKYNYTFATMSNAIGNGIGSLYGGIVLPAKALGGVAEAFSPEMTEAAASDFGLKSTMVLGNYENNYKEAEKIIGDNPQDEGKRHLMTLLKGVVDYEVFKPLNKLISPAETEELGGIVKEASSLKDINKEALTKWTTKVLKGAENTAVETGKIGAAQIGSEYAKNIVDHVLGSNEGAKESDNQIGDKVVEGIKSLPFSMAIPLGLGEFVKGAKHSSVFQENLYNSGLHPETYKAELPKMVEDGTITQEQASQREEVINTMAHVVNSIPNDVELNHNQKVKYALSKIKEIALQAKAGGVDDKALSNFYNNKVNDEVKNRESILNGDHQENEFIPKENIPSQPNPINNVNEKIGDDNAEPKGQEVNNEGAASGTAPIVNPELKDVESSLSEAEKMQFGAGYKDYEFKKENVPTSKIKITEQPSLSEKKVLVEDIKKNGIKDPIIVEYDKESDNYYVKNGNHRAAIAKELGIKEVPTIVAKYKEKSLSNKKEVLKPLLEPNEKTITPKIPFSTKKESQPVKGVSEVEQPAKEEQSEKEYLDKSGKYKLTYENGNAKVIDVNTKKEVSKHLSKKVIQEAANNYDFTIGKEADYSKMPDISDEEESKRWVVENTNSPVELANRYIGEEPEGQSLSTIEKMISDYGIGKTTTKSYARFGDRNNMSMSKAKAYLDNKNGTPLDVTAKELSDHYDVEITPQNLADFMDRFHNGADMATKLRESEISKIAKDKFEKLTGLPLNEETATIAINQKFNKLSKKEQEIATQDYDTRQQLEDAYWQAHKETDGFTKESVSTPIESASKSEKEPPKPPIEDVVKKGEENGNSIRISKAGLKESEYPFSKDFDERGGTEVAANVLHDLKRNAEEKGVALNQQIANEVQAMKGKRGNASEHEIITAGVHLLNIDTQLKEAVVKGIDTDNLIKQRDEAAAVLRQLGNNAGRNLGLFNLVFKNVSDSEISVARNKIRKVLGVTDIPESIEALNKSDLTAEDKKKAEPYVNKIEQLKKEKDQYEQNSIKNISSLNDKEVQEAIKEAHEAGRKEGLSSKTDKAGKEKKSKQLKDLASKLRASDEMDKFLSGSQNITKSGLDLGSYKEIIANLLDGAAKIVGTVEDITEHFKKAIDKIKDVDKAQLFSDVKMVMARSELPNKEDVVNEINKISKNEGATSITKSMVDKGLIKNVVDDIIHSDIPYDKVIETATNELKKNLPDVTKEDVADAYVRRNQFRQESKKNLENAVAQKSIDVKRLTNKEVKLKALEAGEDYHNSATKQEKQKVRAEFEKGIDNKIKELVESKKNKQEPKSELTKAKDAVQASIDSIRAEIADKERKLEKDKLPLHEDVELGRMREVEKSITDLRDKYLPKEAHKFLEEKFLKKRRLDLNKEISDLNDQINSGSRKENSGVRIEDTEHIKTLRKIKEIKQELLDKVAPDLKRVEAEAKKQKQKIDDINKEIEYVKNSKKVFEQSIKSPKEANSQLKASREERDKVYADNGLRVEKNARKPIKVEQQYQKAIDAIDSDKSLSDKEKSDKKDELKQQRDLDLHGTKQGVISNLSDDINNLKKKNIELANNSTLETANKFNDINKKLDEISKGLTPTGENLEDVANKAYEKINKLLEDKNLSDDVKSDLEKIKKDFENNNQLTSDELANKKIKKQWENDIANAEIKINSGNFTELPTTPYEFRRSVELSNLNRQRENTTKGLSNLIIAAKEKNKTFIDKAFDLSTKLLVSGLHTAVRVGEAASFKPVMDSVVEGTTGLIGVNKFTDTPRVSFTEIKRGFKTLAAFKNKESAERFIEKLKNNKILALENLKKAIDNDVKSDIEKAQNDFKKADLDYGISTLYHSIEANSLKTFWDYIAHGATDLDEQIGKGLKKNIGDYKTKLEKTGYVLDGWIRTHSAMKTSISARNEIMRSYASTLKYFQSKGTELNEENLALAHLIAVNDFEAGRLTNKTMFSSFISKGKNHENIWVRGISKTIAPVSTIAVNIAKRGVDYSTLGAEGFVKLANGIKKGVRINELEGKTYDTWVQKMADGIKQIPLQERKYINGVISRGLFGTGLSLLTLWGLSNGKIKYGGTWDDRKKRKVMASDGTQLNPDEWEFFGWKAPKLLNSFMNHVPEMLPIALTANVYQISALDKDGGSMASYTKTVSSEIQARLPFMTLLGLVNDPAKTLQDRFTRIPIAQEGEKLFDKKDREHKTLGEKFKNNVGLDFLNPEKSVDIGEIKNYKEGGRPITNEESVIFVNKRDAEQKAAIENLKEGKSKYNLVLDKDGNVVTKKYSEMSDEQKKEAMTAVKRDATKKVKKELFGEKEESLEEKYGKKVLEQERKQVEAE